MQRLRGLTYTLVEAVFTNDKKLGYSYTASNIVSAIILTLLAELTLVVVGRK